MQKRSKMILGIGTDVGKTIVSAILTRALGFDYWKPVQTGMCKDSHLIQEWVPDAVIHAESYHFATPASPHYAGKLEGIEIVKDRIIPPQSSNGLIIEGCGGVLVPLTNTLLFLDIIKEWSADLILVSRNYLGSINHTLLTIEALQLRQLPIKAIIFNGEPYPEAEELILEHSKTSLFERIYPEEGFDRAVIEKYAVNWSRFLC